LLADDDSEETDTVDLSLADDQELNNPDIELEDPEGNDDLEILRLENEPAETDNDNFDLTLESDSDSGPLDLDLSANN